MLKILKISIFVLVLSIASLAVAEDYNPYTRHLGQEPITVEDLNNYKAVYNKVIEENDYSISLMKITAEDLGTNLKRIDYLESKLTIILSVENPTPQAIEDNFLVKLPSYMKVSQEEIDFIKNDLEEITKSKGGFLGVRLNYFKKLEEEVNKKK